MTYAETDRHRHYVSVVDGSRYGLLLGPFESRRAAEPHVELVRTTARRLDPWASFYGFGTSRLTLRPGQTPPDGRLNRILTPTVEVRRTHAAPSERSPS